MGKYGLILGFCLWHLILFSQSPAYKFKLDYDVPESPAFAVLDANPTNVMRGSAAKEFVVNIANSFISNEGLAKGLALDFNPYFVFGGRVKNIETYYNSRIDRLLANTQFSFASTTSDDFPNDNLFSYGVRITLFDNLDLLSDKELGKDIGDILAGAAEDPDTPGGETNPEAEPKKIDLPALIKAYDKAKERVKLKKGGSLSLGWAQAGRKPGDLLKLDPIIGFRDQLWLSAQYHFGQGLNILGLVMHRSTEMVQQPKEMNEFVMGIGIRKITDKINFGGEIMYSSEKEYLEVAGNVEAKLLDNILLIVSIGNGSDMMNMNNNQLMIKPTLKYNLSQPKK